MFSKPVISYRDLENAVYTSDAIYTSDMGPDSKAIMESSSGHLLNVYYVPETILRA